MDCIILLRGKVVLFFTPPFDRWENLLPGLRAVAYAGFFFKGRVLKFENRADRYFAQCVCVCVGGGGGGGGSEH